MDKGIYCLSLMTEGCTVWVGALGEIPFKAGWYVYIGSALGSGGLHRLQRHIALAAEKNKRPKWHIDYLTSSPSFTLQYAVSAPTESRLECQIVCRLGGAGVPGFGCSDCTCDSHLMRYLRDPRDLILSAFNDLDLHPVMMQEG